MRTEVNPGVTNLPSDLDKLNDDTSQKAQNDNWKRAISRDVYVQEALQVIQDMKELDE